MRSKSFTSPNTSGISALLGASLLWAFSFGLIGTYLTDLNAIMVAWIRLTLSCLLFLPLLRLRGVGGVLLFKLLAIGAVQYGVMYAAYIQSYQYLKGHEVALFTIFTPLYVALIHLLARRQWQTRLVVGALVAVVGAAVIVFRMPDRAVALRGILLLQVANVSFAFGQVAYRHVMQAAPSHVRDENVFAVLYAGGVLLAAVACTVSGGWQAWHFSVTQIGVLVYLGLVPSGIGFFLWNRGARRVTHGTLAAMNNIKIPLAVVATIVLFHEQADLMRLLVGGGVMLGAVWLCERQRA